jgi:hypothetical protein
VKPAPGNRLSITGDGKKSLLMSSAEEPAWHPHGGRTATETGSFLGDGFRKLSGKQETRVTTMSELNAALEHPVYNYKVVGSSPS